MNKLSLLPPDRVEQNLFNYISAKIYPFRLVRGRIYLIPDYSFGLNGVSVQIEAENLPNYDFKTNLDNTYQHLDQDQLDWVLSEKYKEWFDSMYTQPEENIYLGDN